MRCRHHYGRVCVCVCVVQEYASACVCECVRDIPEPSSEFPALKLASAALLPKPRIDGVDTCIYEYIHMHMHMCVCARVHVSMWVACMHVCRESSTQINRTASMAGTPTGCTLSARPSRPHAPTYTPQFFRHPAPLSALSPLPPPSPEHARPRQRPRSLGTP